MKYKRRRLFLLIISLLLFPSSVYAISYNNGIKINNIINYIDILNNFDLLHNLSTTIIFLTIILIALIGVFMFSPKK